MIRIPAENRLLRLVMCAALAINVALATAFITGPGSGYSSGIEGNVLKTVEPSGAPGESVASESCPLTVLIVRDAETGRYITRITTDENGYFRVHLVPGRYTISLESDDGESLLYGKAQEKNVEAGRLTHVTIYTGNKPSKSRAEPMRRDMDA